MNELKIKEYYHFLALVLEYFAVVSLTYTTLKIMRVFLCAEPRWTCAAVSHSVTKTI